MLKKDVYLMMIRSFIKIISLRKMDRGELQEEEYLVETYKEALGMPV